MISRPCSQLLFLFSIPAGRSAGLHHFVGRSDGWKQYSFVLLTRASFRPSVRPSVRPSSSSHSRSLSSVRPFVGPRSSVCPSVRRLSFPLSSTLAKRQGKATNDDGNDDSTAAFLRLAVAPSLPSPIRSDRIRALPQSRRPHAHSRTYTPHTYHRGRKERSKASVRPRPVNSVGPLVGGQQEGHNILWRSAAIQPSSPLLLIEQCRRSRSTGSRCRLRAGRSSSRAT